jgi:NADH:ubiquinone oxidoreductase subunit
LFTFRKGHKVGEDDFEIGYVQKSGVSLGVPARWVITAISRSLRCRRSGTAGCITRSTRCQQMKLHQPKPWQQAHQMNMTGTAHAYRPAGSILGSGPRAKSSADYKPWKPQ